MDRQPPRTISDEIDLYIRTYYSLLRSSGDVQVRAFEEAHCYSNSSLHTGARQEEPDVAAFAYSAGRLPTCMPSVKRIVLGQSQEQFESSGFDVRSWQVVRARGRRRAMRHQGDVLAVFITSISDIDDLIPIVTAYQVEWNKMHLAMSRAGAQADPHQELGLSTGDFDNLVEALGADWERGIDGLRDHGCHLSVRLLAGSFSAYQATAQSWSAASQQGEGASLKNRPFYFVSSNTHSLVNLLGGFARAHRDPILRYAERANPEELSREVARLQGPDQEGTLSNLLYYLLRGYLHEDDGSRAERLEEVQRWDAESGIVSIPSPGKIDVDTQVFDLSKVQADRVDPRIGTADLHRLRASDAVIVNIDYPLGMAAYHHLSAIAQAGGEPRGVYVMGKAATLNARVGDVMICKAVHDEHSKNTYLLRNCFTAADVQPHLTQGTVLDNQKAVTVRSAYLQNRSYMSVFYEEGYTIMEMEAGPYLSSVYELHHPERHPEDEIVNLSQVVPYDVGFLHYASDTPYSRRQSLLSKSMSYFGVDSTYGCAIAIVQRILHAEIARLSAADPVAHA